MSSNRVFKILRKTSTLTDKTQCDIHRTFFFSQKVVTRNYLTRQEIHNQADHKIRSRTILFVFSVINVRVQTNVFLVQNQPVMFQAIIYPTHTRLFINSTGQVYGEKRKFLIQL